MDTKTYDQFPPHLVAPCFALNLVIYALGACIISRLGLPYCILYLIYCLCLEIRLLACHCPNCYYYGSLCGFGKGKISSWLFKKGDPKKFAAKEISWKDLIPDFLVSLIPLAIGIYLLIRDFSPLTLALMVVLLALAMPLTGLVRGQIACKYCKQKELGCPAEELFAKKTDAPASQ
jgi:hypothetical protein